jgi:hypothetical protein
MSKKNILIVGDGNHQFVTNYINWLVKSSSEFNVDVLSCTKISKNKSSSHVKNYFQIDYDFWLIKFILKIKGIRKYFRQFLYKKIIKQLPSYDFIHFHYITVDSYYISKIFNQKTKSKIIFSIWGSDMYGIKKSNEINFIKACQYTYKITFTNEQSIDYFKEKYNWNKNNLKLCRFGLEPLENIKHLTLTKEDCKKELNWDINKKAITIGYNLSTLQQHLEILNQFENNSLIKLKDQLLLVLPITYGGSEVYKKKILDQLNALPFEYKIYDTFLSNDKVAKIRKASDIMIQLQLTDQFSGSMQEHLFTQNVVVTGSWLPYETMKKNGVWFLEIQSVQSLSKLVTEVITNYFDYETKTISNPKAISKLSLWEENIMFWLNLYRN